MKIGIRKPNLKKVIKARTSSKFKRKIKKAINPLYRKRGMGLINNPKKAIYNKIYKRTSFSIIDLFKKKIKIIALFAIILLPITVNASSGALKETSIKQCPNGNYYGYHGKDNHWHMAKKGNTNWTAVGDALSSDPCPKEETVIITPTETEQTETVVDEVENTNINNTENTTEQVNSQAVDNISTNNNNNDDDNDKNNDKTNEISDIKEKNDVDTAKNTTTENPNNNEKPNTIDGIIGLGLIGGGIVAYRKLKKKKK